MSQPRRIAFAFPGDLATPTGGYVYDRRVIDVFRADGHNVRAVSSPPRFPWPSEADIAECAALLHAAAADADALIVDGLALGAMGAATPRPRGAPIIALVHHPLFLETGLTSAQATHLRQSEGAALTRCAAVIATSAATAGIIERAFDLARVHVAEPGVDPAPRAVGSSDGVLRLIAVGAHSARKGYDTLIDALALIQGRWRLDLIGARDRAPQIAQALERRAGNCGVSDRVAFRGALDAPALSAAYIGADVFIHPAWLEGYGMAMAEAVAHGLPLVVSAEAASTGAVDGAGVLTAPAGDAPAFAKAINSLIADPALRARLAAQSWRAAQNQMRWRDTAAKIFGVIDSVQRTRA